MKTIFEVIKCKWIFEVISSFVVIVPDKSDSFNHHAAVSVVNYGISNTVVLKIP